ncbi:probable binding protein component of ABC transporter [Vibrio sp. JCM 18905]|nr:probable binding protein component of ABC transporter [Vibrio sp. JCM 18905]
MSRMTKAPLALLISGMLLGGTFAYAEDKLTVVSWVVHSPRAKWRHITSLSLKNRC